MAGKVIGQTSENDCLHIVNLTRILDIRSPREIIEP
jgi:hypothetical protein